MRIEILGAESLGVRGLSCVVKVGNRTIVIDPGVALGYRRNGLLPHPAQVAVGEEVRRNILQALSEASDVVMSHYHGDHVPLPNANPYQLKAQRVAPLLQGCKLWTKGEAGLSDHMLRRRAALSEALGRGLPVSEGLVDGALSFSMSVPHGEAHSHLGTVMMTRVQGQGLVFVHASDIQLLHGEAVSKILEWAPDIALVGGPPLYLSKVMGPERRRRAWGNARRLTEGVDTLILDHHLLRCREGVRWLDRLSSEAGQEVMCAADYMERERCLLEARREALYEEMSVPDGWHQAYGRGQADTSGYHRYVRVCT